MAFDDRFVKNIRKIFPEARVEIKPWAYNLKYKISIDDAQEGYFEVGVHINIDLFNASNPELVSFTDYRIAKVIDAIKGTIKGANVEYRGSGRLLHALKVTALNGETHCVSVFL